MLNFFVGLLMGAVGMAVVSSLGKKEEGEREEVVKEKRRELKRKKAEYEKEADRVSEEVSGMTDKEVVAEFDRLFDKERRM